MAQRRKRLGRGVSAFRTRSRVKRARALGDWFYNLYARLECCIQGTLAELLIASLEDRGPAQGVWSYMCG